VSTSLRPGRPRLSRLALAAIAVNVAIVVTGGIVRLTGSGLGCPDWPTCEGSRVVPQVGAAAGWHQYIEFGNRLMTFVVLMVAVWLFLAVRRRRGPGPAARWSGWLVAGILAQGVLGGITVRLGLHPLIVALHFLASMVLIAIAVTVHHRVSHGAPAGRVAPRGAAVGRAGGATAVRLRRLATVVVALGAVVLVLGTLVTASGPHAGDPGTPRLGFDIRTVSRTHAVAVWLTVAATVAGWVLAGRHGSPALRRAFAALFGVELVQGAIGYMQYHLGIPAWLVSLHLLGACLFWIAAVRVRLVATAVPVPEAAPGDDTPASAAVAAAG
jgi:cytochrome c oxidase assembly protein subunit 15